MTKGNAISCHQKCFECSTLVTLKIHGGIDVTLVAGRIFLPMLKTLVLDWAMACPNEFGTLLRALPSLEELVMVDVMWKDVEDVSVKCKPQDPNNKIR